MIIDYDRRPGATTEEKLRSLIQSIQLALNEKAETRSLKYSDLNGKPADHIVSTGKSGKWHYTKYASGKVEAWGYVTFETLTFAQSGQLYRSVSNAFDIPAGIFPGTPDHSMAFIQGANMAYIGATVGGVTATGGSCEIWKSTSGSGANVAVHFHMIYIP